MKILLNIDELNKAINSSSNLGFVPTMGSLHMGHVSLIKKSKIRCKRTLVSIFVNPNQFNKKKDYLVYPRNKSKDLKILKRLNVDYVFLPTAKQIYNNKRLKKITLRKKEKILCAKYRKGHFEGVLDVMDRLIKIIKPKLIFMGEKDYQQIILIKNFIKNKYKSKIISCPTIRDKNKVALSSRNSLLNKNSLNSVGLIAKELIKFKSALLNIYTKKLPILNYKKQELKEKFNIKIDYLELRNENDLKMSGINKKKRLFIAYHVNKVRLIDNF
tara:strand:- start:970 stop:1785 length:816 start_codon:yes stop_codon:yes gene_type:complete